MKTLSVAAVLILLAVSVSAAPKKTTSRVQHGAYLTVISGCHDCHSPKSGPGTMAPDPLHLLSGRPATTAAPDKPAPGQINASGDLTAWYGPWGVSYASNLTPDADTGIGKRYSEAAFIRSMRTGKKPEGDPFLPPMPWPNYAKMTDEDLKSIFAYLQTLRPVKNFVRQAPAAPAPSR
jgi:cytochrome c553